MADSKNKSSVARGTRTGTYNGREVVARSGKTRLGSTARSGAREPGSSPANVRRGS